MLAVTACSSDDDASKKPAPVVYETVTFEACEIPESDTSNIPGNDETATYEEFGARFVCNNHYFEIGGIWVTNTSALSDGSLIPSDKCVICNADPAFYGADGTAQYSVWAFTPSNSSYLPQMTFGEGITRRIASAKVNNVAKYWHVIKYGYYAKPGFSEGDYYEVIFTGYDAAGQVTGEVPVVMADYRDGKTFIMEEWTEVDLSALGEVNKVVLTATPSETLSDALYGDFYAVCVDEMKFVQPAE